MTPTHDADAAGLDSTPTTAASAASAASASGGAATSALDHADSDGGPMYCYRHPDRETYVRCGRCDRPICTSCAMMGPVGLRCRTCGKPSRDPLTHLTPVQATTGAAAALGAGTIGAFIGLQIGIFAIFVGAFIGGMIGDAVLRVTGYKRGPVMNVIIGGGLVGGLIIAIVLEELVFTRGAAAGPASRSTPWSRASACTA